MLDLVVLFTLFLCLVGLLAVVHQWELSRGPSQTPVVCRRLLDEWMQAHKVEFPQVQCAFSILNRRLQEMQSKVPLAVVAMNSWCWDNVNVTV